MATGFFDRWEQCVNGADPSDEEYNEFMRQIRDAHVEMHKCMRLVSQTLLDCRDRMEDRSEFRDLVTRIDTLGLYRLN